MGPVHIRGLRGEYYNISCVSQINSLATGMLRYWP